MVSEYLYKELPEIDAKEFNEFLRMSNHHFEEQQKCKYWKRIFANFTLSGKKFLSHFGDCHNLNNKTHNCAYTLCPIRDGDFYTHDL
jgi:hypothetical protein